MVYTACMYKEQEDCEIISKTSCMCVAVLTDGDEKGIIDSHSE